MGSEYDYFGDRARVDLEEGLAEWHFNAMPLSEASQKLQVIR